MENIIQIYSGITRGRVLNGELSAQRLQKLIHLFVYRLFHEDFSPIIRNFVSMIGENMKQSVNKCR